MQSVTAGEAKEGGDGWKQMPTAAHVPLARDRPPPVLHRRGWQRAAAATAVAAANVMAAAAGTAAVAAAGQVEARVGRRAKGHGHWPSEPRGRIRGIWKQSLARSARIGGGGPAHATIRHCYWIGTAAHERGPAPRAVVGRQRGGRRARPALKRCCPAAPACAPTAAGRQSQRASTVAVRSRPRAIQRRRRCDCRGRPRRRRPTTAPCDRPQAAARPYGRRGALERADARLRTADAYSHQEQESGAGSAGTFSSRHTRRASSLFIGFAEHPGPSFVTTAHPPSRLPPVCLGPQRPARAVATLGHVYEVRLWTILLFRPCFSTPTEPSPPRGDCRRLRT